MGAHSVPTSAFWCILGTSATTTAAARARTCATAAPGAIRQLCPGGLAVGGRSAVCHLPQTRSTTDHSASNCRAAQARGQSRGSGARAERARHCPPGRETEEGLGWKREWRGGLPSRPERTRTPPPKQEEKKKRARLSVSLYTRASATRHPAKAARTPPTHRRTADGHAQTPTRAARPQMSDSGRPQDPTVRAPSEAVPHGRWPWWTGTPQPTAQHPPVAPALTTLACQHHKAHPARRPRHVSGTERATRQPNQPPPATTVTTKPNHSSTHPLPPPPPSHAPLPPPPP